MSGSVKELNKFHIYETEKITPKASDAAELSSCSVLSPEIVMHDTFNVILSGTLYITGQETPRITA